MKCYICGADTAVKRSRDIREGRGISRTRVCVKDPSHTFKTVEAQPAVGLERVAVRMTGNGELSKSLFDPERLYNDIEIAVLKRMPKRTIREVSEDAVSAIERKLSTLMEPLSVEESRVHPHSIGVITDEAIRREVEDQLGRSNRMAMVLYALSIRGRKDRPGRTGWTGASDVLEWLYEKFVHLDPALPFNRQVPSEEWWYPSVDAPEPQWVIKRSRGHDVRESHRAFDYGQFVRSIESAMLGREDASLRSRLIAQWVLWGVAGQLVVRSSQLAVGVLDCLRRIDDIAYLRWSAIAKGIESVTEFATEARGLIAYPSPRLDLRVEAAIARSAGLRPQLNPDAGHETIDEADLYGGNQKAFTDRS